MSKAVDIETRSIMALVRESARMRDAAERVDLVVRAIALRRGVQAERYGDESAIVK